MQPPTSTETTAVVRRRPEPAAGLPEGMEERIIDEGQVWQAIRIAGFVGYVPDTITFPKGKPYMMWEAGRISLEVWRQVCAFFEWSQKEFKSETQVRLYYNPANRKWAAWAFPQTPSGMTTQELPDHPDIAPQRAGFPEPWRLSGTIHHHCTMTAFQSETDKHNETDQEGLHVTVGGISSGEYSLHMRVQVRKTEYKVNPLSWFELPEPLLMLPVKLHSQLLEAILKVPPPEDTAFPEQWKTNCHKPTYGGGVKYDGKYDAYSTGHTWAPGAGRSTGSTNTFLVKTNLRDLFSAQEIDFMRAINVMLGDLKITHNRANFLIESPEQNLQPDDQQTVAAFEALAVRLGLKWERVDELFDKWDFPTVVAEIDRVALVVAPAAP